MLEESMLRKQFSEYVLLDSLRQDDLSRCEEILAVMDDVYAVLVTMDFPYVSPVA